MKVSKKHPNTKKSFAVLGAGLMGLAAAYQLVQDGYQPVIFEADDRIGGQAASFNFDGMRIERFYHFHCTSDTAFLEVLAELKLQEKMHWTETRMGYYFQEKIQEWGNPIALLNFSGLSLLAKLRYGVHVFLSTRRNKWDDLDKIESVLWLKRWIGEEAYDVLWGKLFDFKFYEYAHSISAAWTWSRIRRIGRSRYNVFREKLGYLEGGSDTLLNAMRKYIESEGGVMRLNSSVKQVAIADGRVVGVDVETGLEYFDNVISTIPLPYLSGILPGLPEELLSKYKAVESIPVVCVVAKLRKKVTEYFWLNINHLEMEIPGIVEYSNLRPLETTIVYAPYYMPGTNPKFKYSDQQFKDEFRKILQKINPALQDGDFLAMHVNRYRHAQPVCEPEFLKKLPPAQLPVYGLWAADTSYYYPEDRGISESIAFGRKMARDAVKASRDPL